MNVSYTNIVRLILKFRRHNMSHKRKIEKEIAEYKEIINDIKRELESLGNDSFGAKIYNELVEFRIKLNELEEKYAYFN